MSKLARLIAQEEGFYVSGSIPQRQNNPGDLEHSPHSFHTGSDPVGEIDTTENGWADLERQLQLYAQRGLTLREAIYEFAPPIENNSEQYLEFICSGLNLPATYTVAEALKIP